MALFATVPPPASVPEVWEPAARLPYPQSPALTPRRAPLVSRALKTAIATPDAPAAVGPYSQAIATGDLLFCAGQIPLDPATGALEEGDITVQTARVLENVRAVLAANGMTFAHVVKSTVFLTNLADFAAMNAVYAACFTEPFPARSTVQVSALPRGARVEIEVIASRS